ncbi:MAG: hypothetical protein AAB847_01380 [Patescibacteria group bacterium]
MIDKFVPVEEPLRQLPQSDFSYLTSLAQNLREYYEDGTIRERVLDLKLPLEAINALTEQQLDCFMRDMGFVTSAYWHTPARPATNIIIRNLAVPYHYAALKRGMRPILSYLHYSTINCERINLNQPMALDNFRLIRGFVFPYDEDWFIGIHRVIEQEENLFFMNNAIDAIHINDDQCVQCNLEKHADTTRQMHQVLCRMPEKCNPDIYFQKVRKPIMYFDSPVYEGVPEPDSRPRFMRGETGAQSMGVPARVAFLGVEHKQNGLTDHLTEMRQYMPPQYLAVLENLERSASVRNFVLDKKDTYPNLKAAYNQAIEELYRFRLKHLEYAKLYVFDKYQAYGQPGGRGTGGTMLEWLQQLCDETASHIIK